MYFIHKKAVRETAKRHFFAKRLQNYYFFCIYANKNAIFLQSANCSVKLDDFSFLCSVFCVLSGRRPVF